MFTIALFSRAQQDAGTKDFQTLSDGFYYKSPRGWEKLQLISMAGGGLKHVGKLFVPGRRCFGESGQKRISQRGN